MVLGEAYCKRVRRAVQLCKMVLIDGVLWQQEHLLLQSSFREAGAPDDGKLVARFCPLSNCVVCDLAKCSFDG